MANVLAGADALAQTPLTLVEAMQRARTSTAATRALAAAANQAPERVRQACTGFLTPIDITESVQRGDEPVFIFSSLLSQRRDCIFVRNSIILVDFIEMRVREEMPLGEAVVAGAVRFRPMALTAAAVIVGSAVILFDPIFQGLAISRMAGKVALLPTVARHRAGAVLRHASTPDQCLEWRAPIIFTGGGDPMIASRAFQRRSS